MSDKGILYLVATPIGNLEDITLRALRVLREADIIAAEDTRQTLKILNHFDIKKTLVSYHEHNRVEKGNYLISRLLEGKNIALVSDAGTPGISDPGEDLVKLAIDSGIKVTTAPGPVAAVTGLVLSGLPAGRFIFEGFLPMNKRVRKEKILSLKNEARTIILYEAPHKLYNTIKGLYEVLGDRKIVIARELTKMFEELIRTTLSEAVNKYSTESPKGEIVLILEGAGKNGKPDEERKAWDDAGINEQVEAYIRQGMIRKDAMKKTAEEIGISKREVYNSLIGKQKKTDINKKRLT